MWGGYLDGYEGILEGNQVGKLQLNVVYIIFIICIDGFEADFKSNKIESFLLEFLLPKLDYE